MLACGEDDHRDDFGVRTIANVRDVRRESHCHPEAKRRAVALEVILLHVAQSKKDVLQLPLGAAIDTSFQKQRDRGVCRFEATSDNGVLSGHMLFSFSLSGSTACFIIPACHTVNFPPWTLDEQVSFCYSFIMKIKRITTSVEIPEPKIARFAFSDTHFAWVWLLLRLYVGYQWVTAGWEKVTSSAWVGPQAGFALQAFLKGALQNASGPHPAVLGWYAYFISTVALVHPALLSYIVSYGELAVGIGLVLGAFTGIAAFFGILMNFNYLFAGAISINPLLLLIELFLMLAWRNAGWLGLDRFLLPWLGVPWREGKLFKKNEDFCPTEIFLLVMGGILVVVVAFAISFQ